MDAAVATSHATNTYRALNLDEAGLLLLYVGLAIGVPLLIADCHWREKSNGQ